MLAIIDGMKNDRQHEQEIRLVDKRTSRRRKNDAFVIRATIVKHRSVLGHVNRRENFQIFEKTNIGITSSSCPALCFRTETSTAGPTLSRVWKNDEWEKRHGSGSPEALQCHSLLRVQVTFCEYRLHSPLRLHDRDLSRTRCIQQRGHQRRPGHLLEECLRFQASRTGQKKCYSLGHSITMWYTYLDTISG